MLGLVALRMPVAPFAPHFQSQPAAYQPLSFLVVLKYFLLILVLLQLVLIRQTRLILQLVLQLPAVEFHQHVGYQPKLVVPQRLQIDS